MSFGYHLRLNCRAGMIAAVTSRETIHAFVKELVPAIDMIAYGEPNIVHFAEHNPEAAGYTLDQLIMTSNITAHFVDKSGDFYLDVFSCKTFDAATVVEIVRKYFNPVNIDQDFAVRQA